MLKELNQRHEIHFAALNDPRNLEGLSEARIFQPLFFRGTFRARQKVDWIIPQLAQVFCILSRWRLSLLLKKAAANDRCLDHREHYDAIVCDFLFSAENLTDLGSACFFSTMW